MDHIRSIAGSEAEKGRLFERLMKRYFVEDPLYGGRFSDVRLVVRMGGFAARLRRRRHRHRSRGRGARRRRLRHPVQALRPRHQNIEARPRLVHRRFRSRPLHRPHRRRYRRRVGSERRQDHRAAQACVFRAALRRSGEPPVRLAGPRSRPAGRPVLPARILQPAPAPARRVRRRDRRLRGARPRQARHGLRHGQDLRRAAYRRSGRRYRRAGALSGAVDFVVRAVDARMGDAEGDTAPLRRHLLRYPRRSQRRGRLASGTWRSPSPRIRRRSPWRCARRDRTR